MDVWPLLGCLALEKGVDHAPRSCQLQGQEQAVVGLVWRGKKLSFLAPLPGHGGPVCRLTLGFLACVSSGSGGVLLLGCGVCLPDSRWRHLRKSLAILACSSTSSPSMHARGYKVHLYAVHLGYVAIASGCMTQIIFTCRLWALSPNAGDLQQWGLAVPFLFPLLLPAVCHFSPFTGGKVVSA